MRIYNTFTYESDNEAETFDVVITKFNEHFNPKKNITFERFKCLSYKQKEGQTLEQFITELKSLSLSCELGNLREELVRDILVCGIRSQSLRETLFQRENLTLENAISICLTKESTQEHNRQVSNGSFSHQVDELKVGCSQSNFTMFQDQRGLVQVSVRQIALNNQQFVPVEALTTAWEAPGR
ncbi:uncharacterized protein LOC115886161 [Sitophilus oryzae]|uniref:Uncharacterized protein LOC115886161 n=1 Tax=Sitophilus oryzae TaxID=7048 RepID=A0A6J2YB43_SITOR|nr:uncharacterized protein LOC115886161 [Sitophilus oryzae]